MTEKIWVSRHAAQRVQERIGVPRKAVKRIAQKAFDKGIPYDKFTARTKRYADKVYRTRQAGDNMRIYGPFLFLFDGFTLITVWPLPRKLQQ